MPFPASSRLAPLCGFPRAIDAVLLDRDGTVIEDRHYLRDPDGVALLPGAGETLGQLTRAGVRLFLVSNQSGIGRGYFSEADFRACQTRLDELLRPYGAAFTDLRFCPHGPDEGCACRKPRTGMWEALRSTWHLDPARCVMAGDKIEDLMFGVNAGLAAALLVRTGKGKENAARLGLPPAVAGGTPIEARRLADAGHALPSPLVTRLVCVPDLAAMVHVPGLHAQNAHPPLSRQS